MPIQNKSQKYHHGDLRSTLLCEAEELLCEQGIDGLTLRGLAERVGVSRQAPYHHFSSKQGLLFALSEKAFADLDGVLDTFMNDVELPLHERFRLFVINYVRHAVSNPEKYELMFGKATWKNEPTESLVNKGHASFKLYAKLIEDFQEKGDIPKEVDALRLTQASWATLHGLCKLKNDGIFGSSESVEEIALYALSLMQAALYQGK